MGMKEIIRICYEQNIDLKTYVRMYIKALPKSPLTGIYNEV